MYWEELPDECPPEEATDQPVQAAYRVVYSNPPEKEHFESHAKRGDTKPIGVTDCRFASCSFSLSLERMKNYAALPKFQAKGPVFIAKLDIPTGAGRSLIKGKHIDLWMYEQFDPLPLCVTETA